MPVSQRRHESSSPRQLLLVTAFFALLAGAIEAAIVAVEVAVHRLTFSSYDFAWMTPLAYLAFFLPVGLGIALGAPTSASSLTYCRRGS